MKLSKAAQRALELIKTTDLLVTRERCTVYPAHGVKVTIPRKVVEELQNADALTLKGKSAFVKTYTAA
jgi:hypothetical protein